MKVKVKLFVLEYILFKAIFNVHVVNDFIKNYYFTENNASLFFMNKDLMIAFLVYLVKFVPNCEILNKPACRYYFCPSLVI